MPVTSFKCVGNEARTFAPRVSCHRFASYLSYPTRMHRFSRSIRKPGRSRGVKSGRGPNVGGENLRKSVDSFSVSTSDQFAAHQSVRRAPLMKCALATAQG